MLRFNFTNSAVTSVIRAMDILQRCFVCVWACVLQCVGCVQLCVGTCVQLCLGTCVQQCVGCVQRCVGSVSRAARQWRISTSCNAQLSSNEIDSEVKVSLF
jgi:hypothetical protein